MKRKVRPRKPIDIDQERRKLVQSIHVNNNSGNARSILEDALEYVDRPSDNMVEYRERDLKRIMVNEIRHNQTTYENGLKAIYRATKDCSKREQDRIYKMYKNATLAGISQSYPYLADECDNQKHKVNMIRVINKTKKDNWIYIIFNYIL